MKLAGRTGSSVPTVILLGPYWGLGDHRTRAIIFKDLRSKGEGPQLLGICGEVSFTCIFMELGSKQNSVLSHCGIVAQTLYLIGSQITLC